MWHMVIVVQMVKLIDYYNLKKLKEYLDYIVMSFLQVMIFFLNFQKKNQVHFISLTF